MAISVANAQNILKKRYISYKSLVEPLYKKSPTFLQIPKAKWDGGIDLGYRIKTSHNNTGSRDFNKSYLKAVSNAVKVQAFETDNDKYFANWQVGGEIFYKTNSRDGSFVNAVRLELEDARDQIFEKRSRDIFGSGWGELGKLTATNFEDSTNKTITLVDVDSVRNFFEGMVIVAAASLGGAQKTGELVVSNVDFVNKKVTYTTNSITLAAGDYLFQKDDYDSTSRAYMVGLAGWCPTDAELTAETSFFGANRNVGNRHRLAGTDFGTQGSNEAYGDYFETNLGLLKNIEGEVDRIVVNPEVYAKISIELGPEVRYKKDTVMLHKRSGAQIGFNYLEIKSAVGDVKIYSDARCPAKRWWGYKKDESLRIYHLGDTIVMPWVLGLTPKQVGFPITGFNRFGGAFASYAMLQVTNPINTCTGTFK